MNSLLIMSAFACGGEPPQAPFRCHEPAQSPTRVVRTPEYQIISTSVYQYPVYRQPIYQYPINYPVYQQQIFQQPSFSQPVYQRGIFRRSYGGQVFCSGST